MSSILSQSPAVNLARHDGLCLLSAAEAMLKGALESEIEIAVIAGPRSGAFASLFAVGTEPHGANLLRQHGTRLAAVPDAGRAVTLASYAARSGRAAFALIPNQTLDAAMEEIVQATAEPLDRGGAMCLVMEDSPSQYPASCPRQAAQRLGMPCIEAADVGQLRDAMEAALLVSRAGRCPIGLVVHSSILRSADTLELRPNRHSETVEGMLARRKRHRVPRWSEPGGALRMGRRLELNRLRAMPSPGERVPVGFITVGPADRAIYHLTNALGLVGRVPVLQLGLIEPVDDAPASRMLERCRQVIVLEPRPGVLESKVLAIAEAMRRRNEQPASVWGRVIPPDDAGNTHAMETDDDLHPSILARKLTHLLHTIRPTMQVASHLMPDPPPLPVCVQPRGSQIGVNAALAVVRRLVADADQWLRERAPLEEREVEPTALAIDGAEAAGGATRVVHVETWDHNRFQRDGIAAIVHAAREDRSWIMLVCESVSEDVQDLERLARGAIPAECASRVTLETANLADRVALRDLIREATLVDRLTIIIIRDGPPPRYDVKAIEQSLAETDRLGYEPRQRLVRSAGELCTMRHTVDDEAHERRLEHGPSSLQTEFSIDPISKHVGARIHLRIRPLLEEVEVIRTRPPSQAWRRDIAARPPTPKPLHGRQPQWRAHLAGFRSDAPGVAGWVLCEAGRLMGYHVRSTHDPTPIGAGRRAWTQVLFTHPRANELPLPIIARIPYGEADLLLGLDAQEMLRAIGPDAGLRVAHAMRSYVVGNTGLFSEELDHQHNAPSAEKIHASLSAVTQPEPMLLDDFAAVCRTWFHTDRVTDMALLGASYQLGLIPVSPEAIEGAISRIESRGFGRCREAFDFGRRLAIDARLFHRPRETFDDDVSRPARRMALSLSRRTWGGGSAAKRFASLVQQSLDSMPGLAETDPGRQARRDFVIACHRCQIWGGYEYAQSYADLITRMYHADRGETGRALTRNAVLPLADAMLIHDPIYIACMASSPEQRRHLRNRLNVKQARGDRIERRYLTRMELVAFNRRIRADVRTSDWPARAVAMMKRFMPNRWRGTRREREVRQYILDFMNRAVAAASTPSYPRWVEAMRRLHLQAADDRLRGMALAELHMLVEPPE